MTFTIQSLCISIPETLLHVTLKRRAEISADIFARLLQYFFLSYKNLAISGANERIYGNRLERLQFHVLLCPEGILKPVMINMMNYCLSNVITDFYKGPILIYSTHHVSVHYRR